MRIGMIGFGAHVQETLLPVLRSIHVSEVGFVAQSQRPRALLESLALRQFDSVNSMFDEYRPTHVFIAVDSARNGDYLRRSIAAGVAHIFVEKPPATCAAQLHDLIQLSRASSSRITVGMNFRFATLIEEVRRNATEHGGIADIDLTFHATPPAGMDLRGIVHMGLLEFGIHGLDLLAWLTGAPEVKTIDCRPQSGGVRALFLARQATTTGTLRLGTFGTQFAASIRVTFGDGTHICVENFGHMQTWSRAIQSPLATRGKAHVSSHLPFRRLNFDQCGYRPLIRRFLANEPSVELADLLPSYRSIDEATAVYQRNAS